LFSNSNKETSFIESDDDIPKIRFLDSILEKFEYITNWIPNPISWFSGNNIKKKTIDFTGKKQFEVIHTNWYYRRLNRIYCFDENIFIRVHPVQKDPRAFHAYTEVKNIRIKDNQNIIISYNDATSPDYITSTTSNINHMIEIFSQKISSTKIINEN